jgi:hypothetical protein
MEEIKKDFDELGLNMSQIVSVLTFLLEQINKIKFDDVTQIKENLESIKNTLQKRLAEQKN